MLRSRVPGRRAPPPIFHRPFSAKFPRALPLPAIVSGIRAKAPRLLQTISSLRPARVADFPAGAQLLHDASVNAQNPVSLAPLVFCRQVRSRVFSYFLFLRFLGQSPCSGPFIPGRHYCARRTFWKGGAEKVGARYGAAGFSVRVCFLVLASAASLNGE